MFREQPGETKLALSGRSSVAKHAIDLALDRGLLRPENRVTVGGRKLTLSYAATNEVPKSSS